MLNALPRGPDVFVALSSGSRTGRSPVAGPAAPGVIPVARAVQSCVIAANTMAKRAGVTTGLAIADARRRCPGIALVPQQPSLYCTRIHHRIVAAVLDVLPIDAVCSIDELAATGGGPRCPCGRPRAPDQAAPP